MNKINIPLLLTIAVTVLLTLQLKSCFSKSIPNEKLIRTEEQIKALEGKRISDSLVMVEKLKVKDMEIEIARQRDTVLVKQIIQSNDKIKRIPAAVDNLTKSELRKQVTDF